MSEHDIESETVDPLMALVADNPPQTPLELREMLDAFSLALNVNPPDIESIDDVLIESFEGQDLTVDIHRPQGDGPFPILVYLLNPLMLLAPLYFTSFSCAISFFTTSSDGSGTIRTR